MNILVVFSDKYNTLIFVFQNTEEEFQKKILNERIARLSGRIAILQVMENLMHSASL